MTADIVKLPTKKRKAANDKPLTTLQVKNLKEGTIADAHPHRGLRLRANKNGTKAWIYRYRAGDKLKQIKLGTYPGMGLSQARDAFTEQRKLKESHQDPRHVAEDKKNEAQAKAKARKQKAYTFADMVEHYLTEHVEKTWNPTGAKELRRLFEYDLGQLADMRVEDTEKDMLHEHIFKIANRAPGVALRFRNEFTIAWKHAIDTGRTKVACLINKKTGGKLTKGVRERWLSKDELAQLLPWMNHYSQAIEDVLIFSLYTGLRSGEVCKLRDEWLKEESDGWWLTIPANEMKSDHCDHRVPLMGKTLTIAKGRGGRGLWFPARNGGHMQQKVVRTGVAIHSGNSKSKHTKDKPVCPVKNWSAHDLRRTARSHLAKLKCPFEVAEAILHHKLPGVAGRYNQYQYDEEKRHWLSLLADRFNGLEAG